MRAKKVISSSFGNTSKDFSSVYRPERQQDAEFLKQYQPSNNKAILAVGNKLSYGDSCLNDTLISSKRLNRFLEFNIDNNNITTEPGVTFKDLYKLTPQIISPVLPGTMHATIAGGVANDVHGKNQTKHGCIGQHINHIELYLPSGTIHTSKDENSDLFYATIGGLGLTGFIKKINLSILKSSHCLDVKKSAFIDLDHGIRQLTSKKNDFDYSAAWFDPYNKGRGILFNANHINHQMPIVKQLKATIPVTPPFSLINKQTMKSFNRLYYNTMLKKPLNFQQDLLSFNNPLDSIKNWQRLYGKNGLYQFQCIVPFIHCSEFMNLAFEIMQKHQASPSLAVMKKFNKDGLGLLSFAKPGITFAIDFPANKNNKACIEELNQTLIDYQGRVYLAKDLLLNKEQFQTMYPQHNNFIEVLKKYNLNKVFQSKLSQRLEIY